MIALVPYIKLAAFEKEGIVPDVLYRDGTYHLPAGLPDRLPWASFAVTCESFWGTGYPVDGDQKKLAEEG
jgi:hypothetical protein